MPTWPATEVAVARTARVSAVYIGVGGAIVGVYALAIGWDQLGVLPAWWSAPAVILVTGAPVVLAIRARRAPVSRLRAIAGGYAIGCWVTWLSWPVAVAEPPPGEFPWLSDVVLVAIAAAAYAWPAWLAYVYAAVMAVTRGVVRADISGGDAGLPVATQDALFTVAFGVLVVAVVVIVRRAGTRLDAAANDALAAAANEAAIRARNAERARLDALVHDSVMATLLVAARGAGEPTLRAPLARQAELALVELESSAEVNGAEQVVAVDAVAAELVAVAATASADIEVNTRINANGSVPWAVCEAMVAATAEAVRNSVLHAGGPARTVRRRVGIDADDASVRVEIDDDGRGFDRDEISAERLGLDRSLVGRMDALPGGHSEVESTPGKGTTIRLCWTRDEARAERAATSATAAVDDQRAMASFRPWLGRMEAVLVAGVFVTVHAIFAVLGSDALSQVWPAAVATAMMVACVAVLWFGWSYPLSWPVTATVLVTVAAVAAVMFAHLPSHSWPGYGAWHVGATAVLLCIVAVGGRRGWAWLGFACLAGQTMVWTAPGRTGMAVALLGPEMLTLLVATLVGRALARMLAAVKRRHRELLLSVAAEAAHHSRQHELRSRMATLEVMARPKLVRLTQPEPLAETERRECLLVEAQLRDSIRGRSLSGGRVSAAAWWARQRGVDVTLLDDGGLDDRPEAVQDRIRDTVSAELDSVADGRVVARVQPPGRRTLATVLVDSAQVQRVIELDNDGLPAVLQGEGGHPVPRIAGE